MTKMIMMMREMVREREQDASITTGEENKTRARRKNIIKITPSPSPPCMCRGETGIADIRSQH